jgi:hypothetical protein
MSSIYGHKDRLIAVIHTKYNETMKHQDADDQPSLEAKIIKGDRKGQIYTLYVPNF